MSEIRLSLYQKKPDPFASPRPYHNSKNVPVRTSFFIQVHNPGDTEDRVVSDSIRITLRPNFLGGEDIVLSGGKFADGFKGEIFEVSDRKQSKIISVCFEPDNELMPLTDYTITVEAVSEKGGKLLADNGTIRFTTTDLPSVHKLSHSIDVRNENPLKWHGQFFSGILKPSFCTTELSSLPRDEFMDEARKEFPKAWNLQRDFWLSGSDNGKPYHMQVQPNVVREKETRRVTAIDIKDNGVLLKVEDFFGHEQYGIESNRPLSGDYHKGDEVLIFDDVNSEKTTVIEIYDDKKEVLVAPFKQPDNGWRLEYDIPLQLQENPKVPGLFPNKCTHLMKFNPVGTLCYYWGRVDHEWDLVHGRFKRRLVPGFCDAPGDTSIDGRAWTTAKDYVQLHEATYTITSHLIERYGDATADWIWSILNEPDLTIVFWRNKDWIELQKFYDYSSDAVLRAFEDHGYDSDRIIIGGLELGAVMGTNFKAREFLIHCSPNAEGEGALPYNAAYADKRLDSKRSKRVEKLCSKSGGKGAPLDFISIHTYNGSKMAADKLIRAKEIALEVDSEYYKDLWVNNFESVPEWVSIPDKGASECYLGNGYFVSWGADIISRLLNKASEDSRYAYGESIITLWPFIAQNFQCMNDIVREIHVEGEKHVVAVPFFNFVNLLSTISNKFWAIPLQQINGHTISGFVSPSENDNDELRAVIYTHDGDDTQSRSDDSFIFKLKLDNITWNSAKITEYRFDKKHNTYYELAKRLNEVYKNKYQEINVNDSEPSDILKRPGDPANYDFTKEEFRLIKDQSTLKATRISTVNVTGSSLEISAELSANGTNFLVIRKK